jgi:hypothetical protein
VILAFPLPCAKLRRVFPDSLRGKGVWIRRIAACEGGDPEAIVARALATGFSHLFLKVADGAEPYNVDPAAHFDAALELTDRLRSAGVAVWGWHTLYGDKPRFKGAFQEDYHLLEAACARQRLEQLVPAGMQGYALNPEGDYQRIPGRLHKATAFMEAVRAAPELERLPIGLSARKFPAVHHGFPWRAFRDQCDVDLPPVFWIGKRGQGPTQLEESLHQFNQLDPRLPYAPVGPGFCEEDWCPAPEELAAFFEKGLALGLPGASLWSWDDLNAAGEEAAGRDLRQYWQVLAGLTRPSGQPQEEAFGLALEEDETPAALFSTQEPEAELTLEVEAETLIPEPDDGALQLWLTAEAREEPMAAEGEAADLPSEAEDETLAWQAALDQLEAEGAPESEAQAIAPEDFEAPLFAGEPEMEVMVEAGAMLPEADEDEPALLRALQQAEASIEIGPTLRRPAAEATVAPPHPHSATVGRFFKALRTGKLAEALTLDAPGFVHVNRERVARDTVAVYEFYQALLQRLDGKTLAVLAVYGDRNAVHAEWSARTTEGEPIYGLDVFHLNRVGRIVYHHTDFRFTSP